MYALKTTLPPIYAFPGALENPVQNKPNLGEDLRYAFLLPFTQFLVGARRISMLMLLCQVTGKLAIAATTSQCRPRISQGTASVLYVWHAMGIVRRAGITGGLEVPQGTTCKIRVTFAVDHGRLCQPISLPAPCLSNSTLPLATGTLAHPLCCGSQAADWSGRAGPLCTDARERGFSQPSCFGCSTSIPYPRPRTHLRSTILPGRCREVAAIQEDMGDHARSAFLQRANPCISCPACLRSMVFERHPFTAFRLFNGSAAAAPTRGHTATRSHSSGSALRATCALRSADGKWCVLSCYLAILANLSYHHSAEFIGWNDGRS